MPKFIFVFFIVAFSASLTSCNPNDKNKQNLQDSSGSIDTVNSVKLQLVTNDVHFPVQVKASPDSTHRLFIIDLAGKIFILKDSHMLSHPFLDLTNRLENKDHAPNIRGVYSMVFSPQFAQNKKLYVCYNAPTRIDSNVCKLVVSEFTVSDGNPDVADSTSERRVFEVEGHTVQNDPCGMAFGPDGYLYISVGDNGTPMKDRKGQYLDSYLGKLLRINVDKLPYTVPPDNPFVGTRGAKPEIWAYGLRRLWRFSFDKETNVLIGGDVGDKLEEEIDILKKGGNYGWPLIEGDSIRVNKDTLHLANFIAPVAAYGRKDGICVMGGSIYHGQGIPYLDGKYVFGDFNGNLFSLAKDSSGKWQRTSLKVLNKPASPFIINSCDIDGDGEVYFSGILNAKEGAIGAVYKLVRCW